MFAFVQVTCSQCGVTFGLMPEFQNAIGRRTFWCPNGHKQVFIFEDPEAKLRKEIEEAKTEILNLQKRVDAAKAEEAFWKEKFTHAKTMEPVENDVVSCSKCGKEITDATCDDQGGLCDDCCAE